MRALIIALPPQEQAAVLERCLALRNIHYIVLEKPLAADPAEAATTLAKLEQSRKRFEIGYSLLHTNWFRSLQPNLPSRDQVAIEWNFMAHHFSKNVATWKRHHSRGGGVLRYYGIHLLAVLAYWGYDTIHSSSLQERIADESEAWDCVVEGPELRPCRLHVDCRNDSPSFSMVTTRGTAVVDLPEPFALEEPAAPLDARVPVLLRLLKPSASSNSR